MNKIAFFCFFLLSTHLSAQICFTKYSAETCNIHFVTEFGVAYPFSLTKETLDRHLDFNTNLGIMRIIHTRFGVGAHIFVGIYKNGGWHSQIGLRPRIAYYINEALELNFSPGLILYNSPYPDGFAGYSIETNLKWKQHFGLTARADFLADDDLNGKQYVLNLGIQTDGKKGAVFILLAAVASGLGVILSRL